MFTIYWVVSPYSRDLLTVIDAAVECRGSRMEGRNLCLPSIELCLLTTGTCLQSSQLKIIDNRDRPRWIICISFLHPPLNTLGHKLEAHLEYRNYGYNLQFLYLYPLACLLEYNSSIKLRVFYDCFVFNETHLFCIKTL